MQVHYNRQGDYLYAAVFDGHGGELAAQWLSKELHTHVDAVVSGQAPMLPPPAVPPTPFNGNGNGGSPGCTTTGSRTRGLSAQLLSSFQVGAAERDGGIGERVVRRGATRSRAERAVLVGGPDDVGSSVVGEREVPRILDRSPPEPVCRCAPPIQRPLRSPTSTWQVAVPSPTQLLPFGVPALPCRACPASQILPLIRHTNVAESPALSSTALFQVADRELLRYLSGVGGEVTAQAGSTATVAVIRGDRLVVANVGDSQVGARWGKGSE